MAEDMWSHVCSSSQHLYMLIVALFVLFLLNVFALVFGEPGTIAFTVAQLDMILLVIAFVMTSAIYWKCLKRGESDAVV